MSWVRYDDSIAFHHKVIEAGNEAVGAWVRMTAWSSAQLTDGRVPQRIALLIAGTEDVLADLLRVALLDADGDDYRIHDYHDHNPRAADVKEKRRQEAERKAAGRGQQGRADSGRITSAVRDLSARTNDGRPSGQVTAVRPESGWTATGPVPSRPVPFLSEDLNPPARDPSAPARAPTQCTGLAEVDAAWQAAGLPPMQPPNDMQSLAVAIADKQLKPAEACKAWKSIIDAYAAEGFVTKPRASKMLADLDLVWQVVNKQRDPATLGKPKVRSRGDDSHGPVAPASPIFDAAAKKAEREQRLAADNADTRKRFLAGSLSEQEIKWAIRGGVVTQEEVDARRRPVAR